MCPSPFVELRNAYMLRDEASMLIVRLTRQMEWASGDVAVRLAHALERAELRAARRERAIERLTA